MTLPHLQFRNPSLSFVGTISLAISAGALLVETPIGNRKLLAQPIHSAFESAHG